MAEQEGDNAAEQKARNEENKQETEQLLKRQWPEVLAPSLLLGILSAYLLFVAALAAFGVIAFYTQHGLTLRIVFFSCIVLLAVVPLGVIWYLLALFTKKSARNGARAGKQSLWDRMMQSSIGRSLARLGNGRIFRFITFALCIYMIANAIRVFPLHPRFSLAIIVLYIAFFFALATLVAADALQKRIGDIIKDHIDITKKVFHIAAYAYTVAESSRKYIEATEPSHNEAHQSIVAAIKAVDNTTRVIAGTMHDLPPRADQPSREAADATYDDDDEDPSDC